MKRKMNSRAHVDMSSKPIAQSDSYAFHWCDRSGQDVVKSKSSRGRNSDRGDPGMYLLDRFTRVRDDSSIITGSLHECL